MASTAKAQALASTLDGHVTATLVVATLWQVTSSILALVEVKGPSLAFDTSHHILSPSYSSGLRWDAIHFVSISMKGYEFEQQLAFMPFWPLLMRIVAEGMVRIKGLFATIFGGMINMLAAPAAAMFLYKLTRALTGSHRFAFISTLFYALPPHSAAAVSAYTEPMYAYLAFQGYYFAVKKRWVLSVLSLAGATGTRATGIFNIGVLGWQILFGTSLPSFAHLYPAYLAKRALIAVPLCLTVVAPFIAFQAYAYRSFCLDAATSRPWCSSAVPLPYSFVQAEYWNIGILKYWTVEQLPNFLLAAPVLLVSIIPTFTYFRHLFSGRTSEPPKHPALLPFQILHSALIILLVFASHTQIALRVAITDPVVWWNIADVAFKWGPHALRQAGTTAAMKSVHPHSSPAEDQAETVRKEQEEIAAGRRMTRWGRTWVGYVVVWGAITLLLWAGHYPPA